MFPASTHKGQAVAAFPDVCKTPGSGGPVAIPYPTAGPAGGGMKTPPATKPGHGTKPAFGTKPAHGRSNGDAAGLKNRLGVLHQKLMNMPAGNSTQWHAALDDYVMTTSELYKSLSDR